MNSEEKNMEQGNAATSAANKAVESSAEKVVEVEHLKKAFGNHPVLKDVSLYVNKGENLVIMGKSGTGKSVTIKCMVRLIDADEGSIKILGSDVLTLKDEELNAVRKRIGFLFQSAALYDSMTVRENLEFPLRDTKKKKDEVDHLVHDALESVGLAETIDKMPSELSGGMRKRIGLARTLILRPEIILYDEPNTGLDPITTREISHLIVDLQKKYKTSSIIITHDAECARITGNRLMIIDEGLVVAEGTYDELEKSGDKWVKSFFTKVD
jgi:phospholipid/cholesterol/gamma-HCH transport system ATP-binding protein